MAKLLAVLVGLFLIPHFLKAQDMLALSDKERPQIIYNDTTAIYNAIRTVENIYLEDPDSAMHVAANTLAASRKLGYNAGIGLSFSVMGFVYWVQSYNVVSLFYLKHALLYLEKEKMPYDVAKCYRMLGRACTDAENYPAGLDYLNRANEMSWKLGNAELIAEVCNDLARYFWLQNQLDTAWKITSEGFNLARASNGVQQMAILYARFGNIVEKKGNYIAARKYYDSSWLLNKNIGNRRLKAILLNNFSRLYFDKGKYDSSISNAIAGMKLADTIGAFYIKMHSLEMLVKTYDREHDDTKKTFYLQYLNNYRDTIDKVQNDNNFRMLQEYFALNKKLQDMETNEHENQQRMVHAKYQRSIIIVLSTFVVMLIGGIITVYIFYQQKQKLNKLLVRQKEEVELQKNTIESQSLSLRELNELKNKLFAVISHDLRTPIGNLKMTLDFFRDEMLSKEEAIELMQKMIPLVDAADLTMNNLLNWSTSQMHGLKVKPEIFLLNAVTAEIQRVFEQVVSIKKIRLLNNVVAETYAYGDPALIKIVVHNLVSNAVKFTYENGLIEMISGDKDGMHFFAVNDNGKGMTEGEVKNLFNVRTHFSGVGTGGEKGTGLGLLLCKELVELNNGKIWVESTPGKGSTFYFSLPDAAV